MKKKWKIILLAIVVIGGTSGLYAWKEFNRTHADTVKLKPAFSYNAMELVEEFEKDELKANEKFNDKVIAVKGNISKIESSDNTQKILLGDQGSIRSVLCQLDAGHKNQLTNLKEGNPVIIKGVCTGMLMDVILIRCVLTKP